MTICVCAFTQVGVFAFSNYTEVRTTELRPDRTENGLKVVGSDPSGPAVGLTDVTALREVGARTSESAKPVDVNKGKSATNSVMHRASDLACAVGTLACLVLCGLMFMSVAVAGGGSVPGVERVVPAGVWSVVLGLLCMPWGSLMPSLRVPGVFGSYEILSAALDRVPGAAGMFGSLGMYGQWLAMPIVAAVVTVAIVVWFRAGVERGIIITAPSQLERAIEREASMMSKQGVSGGVTRTIGALNRAIGEQEAGGLESAIDTAAASARSIATEAAPSIGTGTGVNADRGMGRSVADRGFKRLI